MHNTVPRILVDEGAELNVSAGSLAVASLSGAGTVTADEAASIATPIETALDHAEGEVLSFRSVSRRPAF